MLETAINPDPRLLTHSIYVCRVGCGENFKMANFMYGYMFFYVLGGVQNGVFFVVENFVAFLGGI